MIQVVDEKITNKVLQAAVQGDYSGLLQLPKADLHAHVLLSAPLADTERILNAPIPKPPSVFNSLQDFLAHLDLHYWPHYNSVDKLVDLCDAALEHMIADGVVVTEMSFDALMPQVASSNWNELAEKIFELQYKHRERITLRPELGFARELPAVVWKPAVEAALKTGLFESIDLYGDEARFGAREFNDYFDIARALDLKIKIHCGEGTDAARMLEEVRFVRPQAVQHGVAAANDQACMDFIRENNIQLNVCPASNVALRVVPSIHAHPIDTLVRNGLRVTLATDDLAIFGRPLSAEYVTLYQIGKLTAAELEQIRLCSLAS